MAKGDYIRVVTKSGERFETAADIGGRKVSSSWTKEGNIQWYVASLYTRGDTPVYSMWFPASEIVSVEIRIKESDG